MAEYDFFEITKLSFDPPEKAATKIENAIEKAKKDLGGMLGSVSQQTERDEINGKMALLERIKTEALRDGKVTPRFLELAQERKEAAKKRLEAAVSLEKLSKKELVVTNGKIKTHKRNTGLSKESIEEVYKFYGFTIVNIEPLAAKPKTPAQAEKTYLDLAKLRGSRDPNPKGADPTGVYDLYGFAAYLKGEPENSAEYRDMATKDIFVLFDEYAKKNSMRNDPLGKLCVAIATAGKTNVFNNEGNRKAYEQFLLLKRPELMDLFRIMKDSAPSDLHDAGFADICIRKIMEFFGDSEVALAIYNDEAGLQDDPYIPEKAVFSVKCAHCQNISEYTSFAEAKRENRCRHCGEKIYRECPQCGKMILSSVNRCPECGFVFADIGLFTKCISLAETALKQGRLEEARKQLTRAKAANPGEHSRTAVVEEKLDAEEAIMAKPLKKLRILMANKQYVAAENFLGETVRRYPQIDVSEQKKEIKHILSSCRDRFADCRDKPLMEKINVCLEILDLCGDFRQANELLVKHPPAPPDRMEASYDDERKAVVVSWAKSKEPGVSYCLVRKSGNMPSAGINDGAVMMDEAIQTSFVDSTVVSGTQYSYTVFAKRRKSVSDHVSAAVRTLSGVTDIRYWQNADTIMVSWRLPENSQGATVAYSVDGREYLLAENAHESAELTKIKYGLPYTISIAANYGKLGKSIKRQVTVTPTPVAGPFQITAGQIKDGTCSIGWSIADKGIDIQVIVNGKVIATTRSEMRSCALKFPKNNHYNIQVKAFSGGQWIPADNELAVNTYEPVLIDGGLSTIAEKTISNSKGKMEQIEIKIKLEEHIPKGVEAFYCIVRTKEQGAVKAPWATEDEVGREADRIDYQTYLQWHQMTKQVTAREEDAYYVTLFAVYRVGEREILSAPCKRKFNRPLNANVFWKVTRSFLGTKLSFEIEANRAMVRRPEIVLCSSPKGKHLSSPDDGAAVELLRISENYYEEPQKRIVENYEVRSSVKRNEKVFLFVTGTSGNELYSVRWAAGFGGKT